MRFGCAVIFFYFAHQRRRQPRLAQDGEVGKHRRLPLSADRRFLAAMSKIESAGLVIAPEKHQRVCLTRTWPSLVGVRRRRSHGRIESGGEIMGEQELAGDQIDSPDAKPQIALRLRSWTLGGDPRGDREGLLIRIQRLRKLGLAEERVAETVERDGEAALGRRV